MHDMSSPKIAFRCFSYLHAATAALVCAAVLGGYARAQTLIRNPEPDSSGIESTAGEDPGSATNPRPRWACNQQTVTADPIWRGQRDLTFAFDIRNEGTADLKIKATGG